MEMGVDMAKRIEIREPVILEVGDTPSGLEQNGPLLRFWVYGNDLKFDSVSDRISTRGIAYHERRFQWRQIYYPAWVITERSNVDGFGPVEELGYYHIVKSWVLTPEETPELFEIKEEIIDMCGGN